MWNLLLLKYFNFFNKLDKLHKSTWQRGGKNTKKQCNKNALPHDFKVGDLVMFSKYNFLGKNKKFTPKWLDPATKC